MNQRLAALDKPFKAFLGTTAAIAVAIVGEQAIPENLRLWAKVYAAGSGWLLAYLLRPKSESTAQRVEIVNSPTEPVPTEEAA